MAHADVEVGHVRPLGAAGHFGEPPEQRKTLVILAALVVAQPGLEQGFVIEGLRLGRLLGVRRRGQHAGEQHEMPERLLRLALVEEMFAHRHVGHVGEHAALVVAHHRVEHLQAALILLVFHQLDRLVVKMLGLAVHIRRHLRPGCGCFRRFLRGCGQDRQQAEQQPQMDTNGHEWIEGFHWVGKAWRTGCCCGGFI